MYYTISIRPSDLIFADETVLFDKFSGSIYTFYSKKYDTKYLNEDDIPEKVNNKSYIYSYMDVPYGTVGTFEVDGIGSHYAFVVIKYTHNILECIFPKISVNNNIVELGQDYTTPSNTNNIYTIVQVKLKKSNYVYPAVLAKDKVNEHSNPLRQYFERKIIPYYSVVYNNTKYIKYKQSLIKRCHINRSNLHKRRLSLFDSLL